MEVKSLALVVDDEPGILRFVKVGLQSAGFDVIATTSGREALSLAQAGEVDIMILDIYMEPLSGFDVLKELRTFSLIPVVIITARSEAAKMALDQGANSYVIKPFLIEQLAVEVRGVLTKESELE